MAGGTSHFNLLLLVVASTVLFIGGCGAAAAEDDDGQRFFVWEGLRDGGEPCDEIYTVREGETLQTISAKCGDPFILEENPYIQEDDDVYPGLTIKVTPYRVVVR